jgi:hypothetical protein
MLCWISVDDATVLVKHGIVGRPFCEQTVSPHRAAWSPSAEKGSQCLDRTADSEQQYSRVRPLASLVDLSGVQTPIPGFAMFVSPDSLQVRRARMLMIRGKLVGCETYSDRILMVRFNFRDSPGAPITNELQLNLSYRGQHQWIDALF